MIGYRAYNLIWSAAAPLGKLWLACHPRHRILLERFQPPILHLDPPIWVHACSVGEVTAAKPILAALRARFPGSPLLLTTATAAGQSLARETYPGYPVAWCPFDAPRVTARFLDAVRPRVLALIETELWPNLLRECHRRGIPAALLNGRISEKHFRRYRQFQGLFRKALHNLSLAGMQNDVYARRLIAMGAPPHHVRITGNIKFDAVPDALEPRARLRLRAENGFSPQAPLLIFGSTRPGDEQLAADCWRALRGEYPALRFIVAPRHPSRIEDAMAPFAGESILRRSEIKQGRVPAGERVFFLDSVGELGRFYAIASLAVIGGSFNPGINGHNPLEPAALGVPVVFGPHMGNFPDPARILVAAGGAVQVHHPDELPGVLRRFLSAPAERHCFGTRARRAVLEQRGATERNVDLVQELLENNRPPDRP